MVAELTNTIFSKARNAKNTLDSKAYLMMKHQPWRRFVLLLSFCYSYRELCVHIYDHSGSIVSPPFHIEKDKDTFLRIFSYIIFGNDECIGFDATTKIQHIRLPAPSRHSHPLQIHRKSIVPDKGNTTLEDEDSLSSHSSDLHNPESLTTEVMPYWVPPLLMRRLLLPLHWPYLPKLLFLKVSCQLARFKLTTTGMKSWRFCF